MSRAEHILDIGCRDCPCQRGQSRISFHILGFTTAHAREGEVAKDSQFWATQSPMRGRAQSQNIQNIRRRYGPCDEGHSSRCFKTLGDATALTRQGEVAKYSEYWATQLLMRGWTTMRNIPNIGRRKCPSMGERTFKSVQILGVATAHAREGNVAKYSKYWATQQPIHQSPGHDLLPSREPLPPQNEVNDTDRLKTQGTTERKRSEQGGR